MIEEFDALCDAVFDDRATAEEMARLEELALASPALRRRYVELADQEATLAWGDEDLGNGAPTPAPARIEPLTGNRPVGGRPAGGRGSKVARWGFAATLTVCCASVAALVAVLALQEPAGSPPFFVQDASPPPAATWAASAGADLFGSATPTVGAAVPVGVEQALRNGWVRVRFARGAEAVLEGPAVFEVGDDRLVLKAGRCSVHAPDGAEGFRVDTPDGQVIDLGTRFAVRVPEGDAATDGGVEVHVVEGAAELHAAGDPGASAPPAADRLTTGQARRMAGGEPLAFDPNAYRETLPDRVISYVADEDADGATVLQSLTVQRAGATLAFAADDLNPARVTSFLNPARAPSFVVPKQARGTLGDWLARDFVLNVGRLNPGGSPTPLTSDPVLAGENRTPGMAVRFERPVTNGPGPDLVVFDLQSVVDRPEGDLFHLCPVKFRPGLRSYTVRRFDLTVGDPGAAVVKPFSLPKLDPDVDPETVSLTAGMPRLTPALRFTANAVAVDLSDLGYEPGVAVQEIFVQDGLDDSKYIDPTVIVGLPADPAVAIPSNADLRRDSL